MLPSGTVKQDYDRKGGGSVTETTRSGTTGETEATIDAQIAAIEEEERAIEAEERELENLKRGRSREIENAREMVSLVCLEEVKEEETNWLYSLMSPVGNLHCVQHIPELEKHIFSVIWRHV